MFLYFSRCKKKFLPNRRPSFEQLAGPDLSLGQAHGAHGEGFDGGAPQAGAGGPAPHGRGTGLRLKPPFGEVGA